MHVLKTTKARSGQRSGRRNSSQGAERLRTSSEIPVRENAFLPKALQDQRLEGSHQKRTARGHQAKLESEELSVNSPSFPHMGQQVNSSTSKPTLCFIF